jgi:hypothetical protein
MNTTKTLMFAAFTALSLGVGSAMAQEGGLSVPAIGFYRAPQAVTTQAPSTGVVQSGSPDIDTTRSQNRYDVTTHPQFDFSGGASGG